jgi:nondiscriminating aspartyl-tRNA synthetase
MLEAMRRLTSELGAYSSKIVIVEGWLHKKRALGGLMFVIIRDRAGLVQAVVEAEPEQAKLDGLYIGTVLRVEGKVKSEPRAPGGCEIHEPTLTVMVPVTEPPLIEIDKPIDHRSENLDTLFEHRVLNLRNLNEQGIFKVRATLTQLLRDFLQANDFVEIQTPKILAGATEGGAEVFKLDYFGQEGTLAQSPQLYKQMLVGAFERVYEIGPAFRAEPSMTTRHMSEVTMLDIEMGFINDHEDVLNMVQDMTYTVLTKLHQDHSKLMADTGAPRLILKPQFPRFSVAEVHKLYSDATGQNTSQEKDLLPAEERWICDYARGNMGCEAVFVTDFPVEAMKFYHMANDDGKTVRWGDLLWRGLEIATCPQREHRHDKLVQQMKDAGIDPEHPGYRYYLQAFKAGLPPHGGCGFGIDRLVQKTLNLQNVKEATLFPRDMHRLTP